MRAMNLHSYETRFPELLRIWLLMAVLLLAGWLNQVSGQAANLDQGANGKSTVPVSPVDWINGNLNANQAHFLEGYSVPYRAILTGLTVNQNYTLVVALDVKNSGKHALDYITHYQRFEPHGIFLHGAETVNPLLNITGFPPAYFTSTDTEPIPVPSSAGSPVPGQPSASFNALAAAERVMTAFNADLLSVTYASHGSLTASQSETVINITFKALKETAVLSWGGHIAREADWGSDPVTGETNSASAINGSPYHMRLKNWIINGVVVSIGNQDRSLKTDAVFIPPTCEVNGPLEACVSTTSLAFTSTVDNTTGLTYLWSIIGSNTAGAKIVNNTLANISVVPIGAAFTPGTFNLQLIVTRNGLKDTCYAGSHVTPGLPVTIYQPVVDAGADVSITHLDVAALNATVAGGKAPYTFSWSPVTGLSDPNVHNPTFTPPSSGIFQFVVTVTDAAGCTDKDTVVVTVTQHADPPCIIDGPDPVCPGSSNIYTGPPPADVSFFAWSVTGNGTITGDSDKGTVTILAGNVCGPYTIQLITATPDGKVKDTCYRTVQVQDNIKPVLHGTAANANLSCGKDVPAAPTITATDNCLANITVQSSSTTEDSTCVNKYRIVRKWWAVDLCGNTSDTLTQVITVNDDVKPVLSGTYEETVNIACVGDIPAPPALTANDNCDGALQPQYSEEGSGTACDSTIVRTWVFTDACGNSVSAKQTIHLKDAVAPKLVGTVQDANVTCSKDVPAPPVITANDNCPAEVKVHFTSTTEDSTCVNKFKIVRKWWAVDGCGNTSDVLTQTIVVNDDVKPILSGTYEETVNIACVGDIPAPPAITANDNCDGALQPQYSEEGSGTACDSTIVRTWVFTDACGNSVSAKQTIHLKDAVAPKLVGSVQDANVTCSKDVPAPPVITANDNCPAEVKVHFTSTTEDSTCVNKFKIVRKWWAVDGCGNTSDVLTQTIVVNDDVKPVLSGTYEETVNVSCVGDIPAPPALTANDNCDGPLQPQYSEEGSGTACDSTIVRTWIFTDACGNSVSAKQTIHLKDAVAPKLVGTVQDANVTCSKDVPAPPVITANDNCPAEVKVHFTSTTEDSTCVNKFKIVRKWWAVDGCGNTSDVLTQTIVVNDDVKPVLSGTYEETVNVSCVGDIPAPPALTANDNCDGPLQPQYSEEGSGTACDSTIVRTWVFTDACGNSVSAKQTIHLKDAVAPKLVGSVQDANVTCSKDVPAPPVITANDNCPAEVKVHFTSTTTDSTCVNKFKIVRKWWAVDGCGNTSEVLTQTITVNDNVKPVITASYEDKIEVKCVGDIPQVPSISGYDNCDGELKPQYSEQGSGTACDSTIVRTWVFTDACGNSASATQTIHLQDLVPPTLNGTAQNAKVTCAKDIPAAPVITASDNCPADVKLNFTEVVYDSTCVNKFRLERTWWAVDGCGNTSAVLNQTIIVNDDVKPVISGTYKETVDVTCVGDIPAPPPLTATDNCAGVLQPDYKAEGSGTACDSTIVRTWVFTDGCGNTATAVQTIRLRDLVRPTLTGTAPNATVQCAQNVPAVPDIKATDNCGYAKVYSSETKKNVVCVNRFVLVRKWWAKDKCGNTSDTLCQTITVFDNTLPVISNKPVDKTLPCGSQPSFNAPSFSDNCGGTVTVVVSDRQEGTSCPVTYIRRWTGTDACGNSVWVEQRVKVLCCESYCSYTQGYYGNVNGKACLPGGGTSTAKAIMLGAVDAQVGDSVIFGLKATGKFFTLFLSDVSNDNIFKMLPGGGTPAALKGYATYSKTATWPLVPVSVAQNNYGKINNVLLAQTMTMFFNFKVTPGLAGLPIQGTLLMTSKLTACGSSIPVSKVDSFDLPKSVVSYLTSIGQANVTGLYNLANKYLGGQTVTGVTASDVNNAVDALNRGFDKCAVLIGWSNAKPACGPQVMATGPENEKLMIVEQEAGTLGVETFPNPYRDAVTFRFTAPETGTLQLLIYNLSGQQVDVLNKGTVQKGSAQTIRYAVPDAHRSTLIYKLSVGRANATGKLIYIKH